MGQFLTDIGQRRSFVAKLAALIVAALALGIAIPFVFAAAVDAVPALAPFLRAEGSEFGFAMALLPAGMFALTAACLVLEAALLGYGKSTLRRILVNESASVRTDIFFIVLRISGLMVVLGLVFSFGGLYVATDAIRAHLDIAVMRDVDSIALQFIAMAVVFSFVNYWIHRAWHSKYLWEIHKVHHSAEDYNVLLPYRNHPVDFIVAALYTALAHAVLGIKPEAIFAWVAVNAVYQSMVHSNYDWKWRWLDYLVITPQAHRIHHSTDPKHFNSNLGILSVWDRLFGTYIPPEENQIVAIGVPDRENFNTGRYLGDEIMAVFFRWIGVKRPAIDRRAS